MPEEALLGTASNCNRMRSVLRHRGTPDAYVALSRPGAAACTNCGRDQLWDAVLTAVAVVFFLHVQENDGSTRWTETGALNAPSSLWISPPVSRWPAAMLVLSPVHSSGLIFYNTRSYTCRPRFS